MINSGFVVTASALDAMTTLLYIIFWNMFRSLWYRCQPISFFLVNWPVVLGGEVQQVNCQQRPTEIAKRWWLISATFLIGSLNQSINIFSCPEQLNKSLAP